MGALFGTADVILCHCESCFVDHEGKGLARV